MSENRSGPTGPLKQWSSAFRGGSERFGDLVSSSSAPRVQASDTFGEELCGELVTFEVIALVK